MIFAKICISMYYKDFILQNVQPAQYAKAPFTRSTRAPTYKATEMTISNMAQIIYCCKANSCLCQTVARAEKFSPCSSQVFTAVIVPSCGPMTAFWPVFAVIVPSSGPMTALGQHTIQLWCTCHHCVTRTVTKQNKPLIISGLLWSIGESNS